MRGTLLGIAGGEIRVKLPDSRKTFRVRNPGMDLDVLRERFEPGSVVLITGDVRYDLKGQPKFMEGLHDIQPVDTAELPQG